MKAKKKKDTQIVLAKEIPISPLSCDLLSGLFSDSREGVLVVDANGVVCFVNDKYKKACSIKKKDIVGHPIAKLNPRERLTRILKHGKTENLVPVKSTHPRFTSYQIPLIIENKIVGAAEKIVFHPENKTAKGGRMNGLSEDRSYTVFDYIGENHTSRYSFDNIIGESAPILNAKATAKLAAQTNVPILIIGESGTGKELFAHAIHQASGRQHCNFVRLNCSCIPTELIESELFGYESGAFTGASRKGKTGKFELANEGTIFLDEIGDMSLNMQAKLLRVLQEKEFEKIGGTTPKSVDFRIISATNRDLQEMIDIQSFRLDLYYRINAITIKVPPLREIKKDIPSMVQHFLKEFNQVRQKKMLAISEKAKVTLMNYDWPGNVRELRNTTERCFYICRGDTLTIEDLPPAVRGYGKSTTVRSKNLPNLKKALEDTEKQLIVETLKLTGANRKEAARILDIHRTGLYQKMKKYNLI
jgi:transcriptional regulator with PAS, ATPase and Fis domain